MEIYQESVIDLLAPPKDRRDLKIRDDAFGNVCIENLKEETITDMDRVSKCY